MVRKKVQTELITGLDIGSTTIRVAVGQLTVSETGTTQLQIIGVSEVSSEGIQRGVITSIEDTVSSISSALEQAERLVGAPIEHVWVGISGTHIVSQESKGVVAVSRPNGEIAEEDVERTVEAAKTVAAPLNYEILHVLPRSFSVDGQSGIKDPVGMTGIRLEVDTKIIHGLSSHLKNVTKAVYRAGVDIDDFVLSVLAAGEVVTSTRQKELGTVVINIGGPTTSMVVYEEGDILHTAILPIGSAHITNDLALGLKTSIDVAEAVKIEYGECVSKGVSKKESINLQDLGADSSDEVSLHYIAQIIEARVSEILEKIDDELAIIERSGLLPAGAVFIGGGAKINGLVPLAKQELGLPATLGSPLDLRGISDKVADISFSVAVGLVRWGSNVVQVSGKKQNIFNITSKLTGQIKKIFKSFVP